jgi:GNAT superfamily N-acetyltransferase
MQGLLFIFELRPDNQNLFLMTIREATVHDIPKLLEFQTQMAAETEGIALDEKTLRLGLHNLLADPAKGKYYVAEENGVLLGCLMTTYEWSDWRNGQVIWIQSVYVAQPYRARGTFSNLYRWVQQMVNNDPNLRGIRLYVDKRNLRAQQIYEKLGMNGEHYQMYEWMKE